MFAFLGGSIAAVFLRDIDKNGFSWLLKLTMLQTKNKAHLLIDVYVQYFTELSDTCLLILWFCMHTDKLK